MARHGRLRTLLTSALVIGAFHAVPAEASAKVRFILDGSGSMWERIDGQPKIATAKKVLGQVLQDLPADAEMGLMSYGLNRKGDCTDIDLLSPIGPNNAA